MEEMIRIEIYGLIFSCFVLFSSTYFVLCDRLPSSNKVDRNGVVNDEPKCGTAKMNYHPCTSKSVADKLFLACCEQFIPEECHFMCQYETDQERAKNMLLQMIKSKCGFKYFSSILYCASQNRDNRACCQDLDLNAPELLVGSRCLRMCDPAGTVVNRITKDDAACLYNWNVILYCHHAGIREM